MAANSKAKSRLLLFNLRQIVQVVADNETSYLVGADMTKKLKIIESEACDLVIASVDGRFIGVGKQSDVGMGEIIEEMEKSGAERLDCRGGSALPGLVDAHSHPVFAGCRVHEFAMKLAGATYLDVQRAGGGIHFTTRATRDASESQLAADFERVAAQMLRSGTTLLEAKSGYGLDEASEMKMLRVLDAANARGPLEISATFCGAHAVPPETTEAAQTREIVDNWLPTLAAERRAGRLQAVENVDVFCERGVFGCDSTREILRAGVAIGLRGNIHADELHAMGAAELAASEGAAAAAHLEVSEIFLPACNKKKSAALIAQCTQLQEISEGGIAALARSRTVAVLLPTTAYILRLRPPPARRLIDANAIVALGSDFNPNAPCLAMPLVMHLACVNMQLSMPEALVAATLNAAHSLGRGQTHGAVAVGRQADVIVLLAPRWEHLIYQLGNHERLIQAVIKKGCVVHSSLA